MALVQVEIALNHVLEDSEPGAGFGLLVDSIKVTLIEETCRLHVELMPP